MWVNRTEGLMPAGRYTFDSKGRMVNPPAEEPDVPDVPNPPVDPEEPDPPVEPEDPDLPKKNGVISENGGLYYYVDGVLKNNAGLLKFTDDAGKDYYIYVRSNGQLAVGTYWITNTNKLLPSAQYTFDQNGRYYPPETEEPDVPVQPDVKNGVIRDEDGKLRYYVNGSLYSGYGIIELTDELGLTYYIYVRSSTRTVVTGTYWPSHRNGYLTNASYDWGEDGRYYPTSITPDPEEPEQPPVDPDEPQPELKNGIYLEGSNYYFYIDGVKQKNTGIHQLVDEEGKIYYIYVRTNGNLATGKYWPTHRNGYLENKTYDWGADGKYYPAQ